MFAVSVIPLTLEHTNLKNLKEGNQVNIEVDILSKYIESLLGKQDQTKKQGLDKNFLKKHGYA
jgi:riboflavin synthase